MSKFVGKFRKNRNYNDDYGFNTQLENKKKTRQRDTSKKLRYIDDYDSDVAVMEYKTRK